jgi:hypothetical protein
VSKSLLLGGYPFMQLLNIVRIALVAE